jgi:hypothetical protein
VGSHLALRCFSSLTGSFGFWFPRWLWVSIFTIPYALIVRNSGLSSTSGIMVDLTGNMNSRSFRRKKRLLGSRCGAKRVYPLRILLSSLSLVPMLFRFVTSLSLPVALSVSLGLGRLGSSLDKLASVCNGWRSPATGRYQSHPRISAFNHLGLSSSSSRSGVVPHRFSSSDPIGVVHGGGMHDRSNFQNSNFNRYRRRNLHWHPIQPRGPIGLLGPSAFRCFFCKALGHLELFCPSKKSFFGFPLASFPAFGSQAILVGNRNSPDHSTWFRSPMVSLSGGPPCFSCFEEFAREVLKNPNRHLSSTRRFLWVSLHQNPKLLPLRPLVGDLRFPS